MLSLQPADEENLFDGLKEEQQDQYQQWTEQDEKADWQRRSPDSGDTNSHLAPSRPAAYCPTPSPHHSTTSTSSSHDTIDYFCERTNAYARRPCKKHRTEKKENEDSNATDSDEEERAWDDVTRAEMQAFIGCVICMGILRIKDTKRYWLEGLGPAFIRRTFARKRFLGLLANFHISEPPAADSNNHGFKVRMLVDCETNYVVRFECIRAKKQDGPEHGLSHDVVLRLLGGLREKAWHAVGMDGFFSSVQLFKDMDERGFLAVATTRTWIMGFPQAPLLVNKKLSAGQFIARQQRLSRNDALTCVSWMDKKPVNLYTTIPLPLALTTCRRWRRANGQGRHRQLSCPQVLTTYMQYMRGVDVYSQRESYARIGRKTPRWWPRLAWSMIDKAINNAYVLHQLRATGRKLTPTQFREQLMVALVDGFKQRKKLGRPQKVQARAGEPQHIPMMLVDEDVCVVCAKGPKKKHGQHKSRTREACETCNCACHLACWKEHLPAELVEEE